MTFSQLRIFLTLSEIQSFTKTAKQLGCAQSGVTAQIKQLEKELEVRLFERIGKKVSLTAEGAMLVPYATQILNLEAEISDLYTEGGRITIGVSKLLASYLLQDIVREYKDLHPKVEVYIHLLDSDTDTAGLIGNQMDAALVLDSLEKDHAILTLAKRKEKIILAAPFTHELAGKSMITAEHLSHALFLVPDLGCSYRTYFERDLLSLGVRPKIALESNSIQTLRECSLSGMGLCLLPELALKKELMYHSFEKVNHKTGYPVYTQLLVHRDKWISPALQGFLDVASHYLATNI